MNEQLQIDQEVSAPIKKKKWKIALSIFLYVLFGILSALAAAVLSLAVWYKATFNLAFKELLYNMTGNLKGTGQSTINEILAASVPWACVAVVLYIAAIVCIHKIKKLSDKKKLLLRLGAGVVAIALVGSTIFGIFALRLPEYLKTLNQSSEFYDQYYVDPADVKITADGKTKNLIYIYLESMETTYADAKITDDSEKINYIPYLTQLAQENVSFNNKAEGEGLGGFHSPLGTGWTMAGLLSTTSGIHFAFPQGHNGMSAASSFASNLTTLGDILADRGYQNYFLCGSDATFGGRRLYFTQHGNYTIYDLLTARQEGYLRSDYHDGWWGYEDFHLYDIAKDKLTQLAASDQPFNFTMLTVDTHHNNGHRCDLCGLEYGYRLENVVSCADQQIYNFISWLKDQPFYEDCAIVISGDHRRMDTTLVKNRAEIERTIYNCFINAAQEPTEKFSRTFTSFDMFPSTLAAMGFKIAGNRLGLGVNLFSDIQTLSERLGYDVVALEMEKKSKFYDDHFVDE